MTKLDPNAYALLLGIAVIFGLSREWIVAALIFPPMIRMIVDYCKHSPPVQYDVPTAAAPARVPVEADYIGPKLIAGPDVQ